MGLRFLKSAAVALCVFLLARMKGYMSALTGPMTWPVLAGFALGQGWAVWRLRRDPSPRLSRTAGRQLLFGFLAMLFVPSIGDDGYMVFITRVNHQYNLAIGLYALVGATGLFGSLYAMMTARLVLSDGDEVSLASLRTRPLGVVALLVFAVGSGAWMLSALRSWPTMSNWLIGRFLEGYGVIVCPLALVAPPVATTVGAERWRRLGAALRRVRPRTAAACVVAVVAAGFALYRYEHRPLPTGDDGFTLGMTRAQVEALARSRGAQLADARNPYTGKAESAYSHSGRQLIVGYEHDEVSYLIFRRLGASFEEDKVGFERRFGGMSLGSWRAFTGEQLKAPGADPEPVEEDIWRDGRTEVVLRLMKADRRLDVETEYRTQRYGM